MGGSLYGLGRLPRAEYLALERRLRAYLDEKLGDHYRIPRYYGSKADFGDVDVVVSEAAIATTWHDLRAGLVADLGIERAQVSGALFSTVYQDFQVDYILRPARTFEITDAFLCFNDLGNLLGKIFKRMHLKYGENGLQYVCRRSSGNHTRDIDVCLDFERICGFLALDFSAWQAGFATLEAMFRWLIASPWFSVAPYRSPSHSARAQGKHRPTIRRFLAWLDENHIDQTCTYPPSEALLPRIDSAFPAANLLENIAAEQAAEARTAAVKARFGGKRVMQLIPELSGRQLGEFIQSFRAGFSDFEAEVCQLTPAEVDRRVLAHWAARSPR